MRLGAKWNYGFVGVGLLLAGLIAAEPIVAQEYIPPRRGIPGRREGAGTRGTCLVGAAPMVALMPADNVSRSLDRPTFFWFVPTTPATQGELRLLENNRVIWQEPVSVTGGGIMAWQLSAQAPALQPNRTYRWQFSVICDRQQPSKNPFVQGTLEPIAPEADLARQLQTATPEQRPVLLAAHGIWQDAVTDLALQRCANPANSTAKQHWMRLLRSVQLDAIADAPLTATCSIMGAK